METLSIQTAKKPERFSFAYRTGRRVLAFALAAVLLVLTNWVKLTKKWHPIVFIGLSAAVGVVFRFGGV